GIVGEISEPRHRPFNCLCICPALPQAVDFFDEPSMFFLACLPVALFLALFQFKRYARILRMNVAQGVPLVDSLGVLAALFKLPGLGYNRVYEVATLSDKLQLLCELC